MRSKTNPKNLVILGAGGFAREVAWLIQDINRAQKQPEWNIVGFWGHENRGETLNGIKVVTENELQQYLPDLYATVAIGNPIIRERAVKEATDLGCKFATLIHPSVMYDKGSAMIGSGAIICAGNIITVNVKIGAHVIVNLDCTIGHDCNIEDFVTISPGVHLSGYTTLRKSSYIGTGAVTVEKHEIGANAVIGAGAAVVKDIPENVTAVGVPAKVLIKP